MLTGKYKRGTDAPAGDTLRQHPQSGEPLRTESNWALVEKLEAFLRPDADGRFWNCVRFGCWRRPPVASVIAGGHQAGATGSQRQGREWTLTSEDLAEIDRLRERVDGAVDGITLRSVVCTRRLRCIVVAPLYALSLVTSPCLAQTTSKEAPRSCRISPDVDHVTRQYQAI